MIIKHILKNGKYQEFLDNLLEINKASTKLDEEDIRVLANVYIEAYKQSVFENRDIALIFLAALTASLLVNALINVQYRIYKLRLLEEFHNLELISLLHMNRNGINVYQILLEINKYSVYLKPYITVCLNSYNNDPIKALDNLILQVDNDSFSKFVGILKSCLTKPKDVNYEVLQLQRKLRITSERLDIEKKLEFKKVCLTVAQLPLILLFVLNLLMPMLEQVNLSMVY